MTLRQRIFKVVRVGRRHYFVILGYKAKIISRLSTYLKLRDLKYRYDQDIRDLRYFNDKDMKELASLHRELALLRNQVAALRNEVRKTNNQMTMNMAASYRIKQYDIEIESWHDGIGVTDEVGLSIEREL